MQEYGTVVVIIVVDAPGAVVVVVHGELQFWYSVATPTHPRPPGAGGGSSHVRLLS